MGLDYLLQRIDPVNDRSEFASLEQILENEQFIYSTAGRVGVSVTMDVQVNARILEGSAGQDGWDFGYCVKNDIIQFTYLREILPSIIHHPDRPQGLDQVEIRKAAYSGDFSAKEISGKLDGVSADSSGCAVDQDLLPGLDLSSLKTAQGSHPPTHCSSSLPKTEIGRFVRH